ncbi:TetR/AcrR family transcriptional regulator [Nonomuraea fuscirosea]|jgi:TetR/AcrR family transcriptional regulator, fatty acid metabolism regulator protein|uniref:TetR/AcrR family transcriptional regulator n=1 Tax=Nonomuraea fuscirosea TaxID=1291556 RepID=UPI002DDBC764|nr:TetR/AcrR family transcriptional regulator [Nonomuraea fuscirosea]WSA58068.1 TetR family transcriptional regulator [Nonomuraea fuscirosea]
MRSENEPSGQKPRSFIEEARRAQIVGSAVAVIAEAGFAKASLARIAEHAGVSKGVISYHFAGKDELMEEVVRHSYEGAAEHVAARMEGLSTATELVRTHILAVAEHMRGHRDQIKALGEIFNNLRTADGSPRFGINGNEELYRMLEHLYRLGQAAGEFRPFDTRVMAVTHQAAVDTMFAYWVANPDHDLAAHARELADLIERACRA